MTIYGGCLCEEVRYKVDGPLYEARNCHCSMCRRLSGAAFGTYARVNPTDFRWVSGAEYVAVYESSPGGGRCFCQKCGSTLGAKLRGKVSYITLGTVDGEPGVRPEAHVFVGSKATWYEITDGIPQFEEWPTQIG